MMSTRYGDRGYDRYGDADEDRYGERDFERSEGRGYGDYGSRYARGQDYGPSSRGYKSGRDYDDSGRDYSRDYGADYDRGYSTRGYYGRNYGSRYGRESLSSGPSGRDFGGGDEREYGRDYGRDAGRDYEAEPIRGHETDYGRTTNRFYGRSGFDFGREDYGRGPDRSNFGSARSDYGNHAYGGRIDERGMSREGRGRGWRGWWDRAADEVLSWFGDEDAERRRRIDELREARGYGSGKFRGRGPKNYRRSDERIHEEISDRLTDNEWLDASDVDVSVNSGIVILTGTVDSRYAKRLAEDIADSVSGVINVQNNLLVENRQTGLTAGLAETTTDASRTLPATDAPEANRASKAVGKS